MIQMLNACVAMLNGGDTGVVPNGCAARGAENADRFVAVKDDVYGAGTAPEGDVAAAAAPISPAPEPISQSVTKRNELSIAVGFGTVPSYLGSNDRAAFPGIAFRGKVNGYSFSSRGTNLSVDLLRDRKGSNTDFVAGPFVNFRADRTRGIKDVRVKALGKLQGSWEIGGSVGVRQKHVILPGYDTLSLRVRFLKDVGGGHGSHLITPSVEYGAALSKSVFVALSASADYAGKGFGRHYFDVSATGARASGLAPFAAAGTKSGWMKTSFSLGAAKSLSGDLRGKGFTLLALASLGKLHGRYAASPIVAQAGKAGQKSAGLAIAYSF